MDQNAKKTEISRILGKKFLGSGLADIVGPVIRNMAIFFLGLNISNK